MEIWKDIKGYERYYQVSNLGNVKSLTRRSKHYKGGEKTTHERILKPTSKSGYCSIALCKNGRAETCLIHRLMGKAFLPNPENKRTINHLNGIKTDNRIENLEWATYKENMNHAFDTGIRTRFFRNKITEKQVKEIKNSKLIQTKLASKYNLTQANISAIVNYKSWKYI